MRNQGKRENSTWLEHERLGFNYRLSDINCVLGIAQLERINEILKRRESIAALYNDKLSSIKQIKLLFSANKYIKRSWFVYVIQLDKSFSCDDRDKIMKELKKEGIECSVYFPAIHLQPFYKKQFGYKKGDFPVTETISARTIALPFHNNLKEKDIEYICRKLEKLLK